MLRILAERNRPHGQMLGEEAQEALQGKKLGFSTAMTSVCLYLCLFTVGEPGTQLSLIAPISLLQNWRIPALSLQHLPFPSRPSSTTATSGRICLSWASPSEPGCLS